MSGRKLRYKLVFLTGAGVSKESGIPTFRDSADNYWCNVNPVFLCTAAALETNPQYVLDFYNERRLQLYYAKPNHAHRVIAGLEKDYEVVVITQNVDDLHERARSTNVIHTHGELTKVTSSAYRTCPDYIRTYPMQDRITIRLLLIDGYVDDNTRRKSLEHLQSAGYNLLDLFTYSSFATRLNHGGSSICRSVSVSAKEIF